MKREPALTPPLVNIPRFLIGTAALLFGAVSYFLTRPADLSHFLTRFNLHLSLNHNLPDMLGPLGGSLPSLAHVFAFILLTACIVNTEKRIHLISICVSWMVIEILFELGQHFGPRPLSPIPAWITEIPVLKKIASYFHHGTFDPRDLAAVALGAVLGYAVLSRTGNILTSKPHEPENAWLCKTPPLCFPRRDYPIGSHDHCGHRYR